MLEPIHATRACILAAAAGFSTLAFQVFAHRMVSAKLLNNYAFLVISLTMLGFAASGVFLSRWLKPIMQRYNNSMPLFAALFVICTILCSMIFYGAEAVTQSPASSRPAFLGRLLKTLPLALLFAVPFTFTGLMLGALLSDETLPARKIYFADLAGSCLGALLAIPGISTLGVENCMLLCGAILLVVTCYAARPTARIPQGLCALALLAILLGFILPNRMFSMHYPPDTILHLASRPNSPYKVEHIVWDPTARIELTDLGPRKPFKDFSFPCLIGDNLQFHLLFQKMFTQNNYAFTFALKYDGKLESLKGIDRTIYAAAYAARTVEKPNVVVIGVGGGFDLLTALYHDCSSVTGVEVNSATLHILKELKKDYFAPWVQDPRVKLEFGEGRHYLASRNEKYDVIQLSGVDSYSGGSASAHVFSENFLYTREAFDLYLSRLSPNGVLNMMRLEHQPPSEMLKAVATAVESLRGSGIANPNQHIVTITSTEMNFVAMLVKKSPFKLDEITRLNKWLADNPTMKVSAPLADPKIPSAYQAFLELNNPAKEQEFINNYPFSITPVDDNRPFYFRHTFWWHLFPEEGWIWQRVPMGEYTLVTLTFLISLTALVCVLLPLVILAQAPKQAGTARYGFIFACTALGFMALEIALLQKYSLFLGHPNYALSVVLSALLLGTGLGALYSDKISTALKGQRYVSYALCGLILLELVLIAPRLGAGAGLPFILRAAITALFVMAPGLLMGTFVPIALIHLKKNAPAFVPWAWGVNGIVSVLAPVLAVALAMTHGSQLLALAALPFYLVAGWLYPPMQNEAATSSETAATATPESIPSPS